MKKIVLGALVLASSASLALAQGPKSNADAKANVITVKLVDKSLTEYVFEPASITAKPGDLIRFVQFGAMPHNVAFKAVPDGVDLGDYKQSEILVTKDQAFEVRVDGRFKNGKYDLICIPHEAMGMKGTLTISGVK